MSQEQKHHDSERIVLPHDQQSNAKPDELVSRSPFIPDKVRVIHGANEQYFDNLVGRTVESIRKSLREVFNIPSDADAVVDGRTVDESYMVSAGQNLEFSKSAGVKGHQGRMDGLELLFR